MAEHQESSAGDTFRFIERLAAELAELAARNDEDLLAYLLDVAREEALAVVTRRTAGEATAGTRPAAQASRPP